MKSAYELAMERLEKNNPSEKAISDADKARLAEIEALYRSKIAEREVFLGGLLARAKADGAYSEIAELEEQLSREVRKLRDQCEEEKEVVRAGKH
ncbi:MAG: hypothetical protein KDN22_04810 [Verrucomicrobiae bacterium]|nr:hypothetical protein [Verrucomicrobiae bacterium]